VANIPIHPRRPESAAGHADTRDPAEQHRPTAKRSDELILAHHPGSLHPLARLCVDANGVSDLLNLSVRTVRAMNARGTLPRPLKIGRRCVWRVDELRAWVARGAPSRERWEVKP
jgi:predicted DNA-binding transcriptional regulator AlpA